MDSDSGRRVDTFFEELSKEFGMKDIENLKQTFKGLSIVLESKDDLKKAIEYLRKSEKIDDDKAAEMQQAAEETRAFRDTIAKAVRDLNSDLSEIKSGVSDFEKYQKALYTPTLEVQKKLLEEMGSAKTLTFAQAMSSHLVESFGKDQSFKKLFGGNEASQTLSKGISGMISSFATLKEGLSGLRKGSAARTAIEAKQSMNKAERERNYLSMQIFKEREELERLKKSGADTSKQKTKIKELEDKYREQTEKLSESMAKLGAVINARMRGIEIGSTKFNESVEKAKAGFAENILKAANVSSGVSDKEISEDMIDSASSKENDQEQKTIGSNSSTSGGGKQGGKRSGRGKNKGGGGGNDSALIAKSVAGINNSTSSTWHYISNLSNIEKTKTPNNLKQLLGALALWVEGELKDKDDEKAEEKTDSSVVAGGAPMGAPMGMMGGVGALLGKAALVGALGFGAYKLGNWLGDKMDENATEKELHEANEKKQKEQQERADRLLEYAQADDEGKDKIAKKNYEKYVEGAEKVNESKARQQKLIAEKNEALKSGDTKKAQKLLEKIAEEREKMLEYSREREKYKEIIDKDNARKERAKQEIENKSKSEVDMKKNEVNSDRSANAMERVADKLDALTDRMPEMISAGTSSGINNA